MSQNSVIYMYAMFQKRSFQNSGESPYEKHKLNNYAEKQFF